MNNKNLTLSASFGLPVYLYDKAEKLFLQKWGKQIFLNLFALSLRYFANTDLKCL